MSKSSPAKPRKPTAPRKLRAKPKPKVTHESLAEHMANLLSNAHGLDLPQQVRRQEILGAYRELNPKWAAVRVHN